jgi:hypothetical protein
MSTIGNVRMNATTPEVTTREPKEKQEAAVQEPKDTVVRSEATGDGKTMGQIIKQSMKDYSAKGGDLAGTTAGGALGLVGMGVGAAVGVLGGAMVLGAVGVGIGAVAAAATTKGLLSFVSSTFATSSALAKLGIIGGGATVGTGGLLAGYKIPEAAGKVVGGVAGAVVGVGKAIAHKLGGGDK